MLHILANLHHRLLLIPKRLQSQPILPEKKKDILKMALKEKRYKYLCTCFFLFSWTIGAFFVGLEGTDESESIESNL